MRSKMEVLLQYCTAEALLEEGGADEAQRQQLAAVHHTLGWLLRKQPRPPVPGAPEIHDYCDFFVDQLIPLDLLQEHAAPPLRGGPVRLQDVSRDSANPRTRSG